MENWIKHVRNDNKIFQTMLLIYQYMKIHVNIEVFIFFSGPHLVTFRGYRGYSWIWTHKLLLAWGTLLGQGFELWPVVGQLRSRQMPYCCTTLQSLRKLYYMSVLSPGTEPSLDLKRSKLYLHEIFALSWKSMRVFKTL